MQSRIERIGIHLLAFFVARCQLLFMCPFIVPFFMAAYMQGQSSIWMFLFLLLGGYSKLGALGVVRYGVVLLLLLVWTKFRKKSETDTGIYLVALMSCVILWLVSIFLFFVLQKESWNVLYILFEGLLSFSATIVLEQWMYGLKQAPRFGRRLHDKWGYNGVRGKTWQEMALTEERMVQRIVGNRMYDFGQAFLAMRNMLEWYEAKRVPVSLSGLSNMYLSGDGISLLNAVESQSNRFVEMRKNFIQQLGRVGEVIVSFRNENSKLVNGNVPFEQDVRERCSRMGVQVVRLLCYQDLNGRITIYLSCYKKSKGKVAGTELAKGISKAIGKKMICENFGERFVGEEESFLVFAEDANYMLTTGVVRKEKKGEECSGDNFSITKLENQLAVCMLADGMGSGMRASLESEHVVDLFEQFLNAGFGRELSIAFLNSFLSFVADGTMSSTLDLTMIDLYTGMADFIKLGASTTFLKHGKQVECIRSTSLPMGVLEQVEFDTCSRLLYHGDIIVMISDGILDSICANDREELLAEYIANCDSLNAQGLAEQMMETIEQMQTFENRDDCMILVVAIWEK